MRKVLFWLHLIAGVVGGVVILVMSVTGALLTFQQSVLRMIERDQRVLDRPVADGERLPISDLLKRVREQLPASEPTTITMDANPQIAWTVATGPTSIAFVDPRSGAILGTGATGARNFYRSVTNWHRYLAMVGDSRTTGRAITGACNAAFLVLALSGLYLWLPKQFSWRHVRPIVWFRGGLRGKARDFNWHNAIGLWCAPVIVVLTATGMVISYPWASNLVYDLTGSPRPAAAQGGRGGSPAAGQPAGPQGGRGGEGPARSAEAARPSDAPSPTPIVEANLDGALTTAKNQMPTWGTIAMRLPARGGAPVTFTMSDGAYWNSFARSTLTVDSQSAGVVRWDPYAAQNAGQKLRGWMRFAHTGELGGKVGEAVAGVACVGGAFLVYTGIALALRRFAAWRSRRVSARLPESRSTAA